MNRVAVVVVAALLPVITSVFSARKEVVGLAALLSVPTLLFLARRDAVPVAKEKVTPLDVFIALYFACGALGLLVGIVRGNDLVLVAGQLLPPLLLAAGYVAALSSRHPSDREHLVLTLAAFTVLLSIPALRPSIEWLLPGLDGQYERFLGKSALLCPMAVVLSAGVLYRSRPILATCISASCVLLLLLTFTRSYWLGGMLAGGLMAIGYLLGRRRRPRSRSHRLRAVALLLVVCGALAAAAAATPLGSALSERATSVGGAPEAEYPVAVRKFELAAGWRAIKAHPIVGLGLGGEFRSLYQVGDDHVVYGQTNFVHSVWLYFPLKFGILGFLTAAALLASVGWATATGLRCARRTGDLWPLAFAAAFVVVVAASVSAPNLIDPVYAATVGVVAGFIPRPTVVPGSTRLAPRALALSLGLGVAAMAVVLFLSARGGSDSTVRVAAVQDETTRLLVSGREIRAAGRRSPTGRVLAWWQSVQFALPVEKVAQNYEAIEVRRSSLRRRLLRYRPVFLEQKPLILDEVIRGKDAWVFGVVGPDGLSPDRDTAGTPALLRLTKRGETWRLTQDPWLQP